MGQGHATPRRQRLVGALVIAALALVAGNASTAALQSQPAVLSWGNNASGELADGTTTMRLTPVASPALANATSMSVGRVHGLAIVDGGGVVAWGHNASGQLGDGTTTDKPSPVPVPGLVGATGVSAGNALSLALLGDGSVLAWGNNASGQLGDGSAPTDHATPVPVSGLGSGSGAVAVAAGDSHALALLADGSVLAWGNNASGQLGDGTAPTDHATPVPVSGLGPGSGVVAIAAGGSFSLALRSDGSVLAWGNNASGQLGDGTAPTDQSTPQPVSGLGAGSGTVKVVAGGTAAYALRADGTVLAWGNNALGELGDGSAPNDQPVPVLVGSLSGIADLAAGDEHAIAVGHDGAVWAWGANALGQLGDGSTTARSTPVAVVGLGAGSGVGAVLAAGNHSHALILPAGSSPVSGVGPTRSSDAPHATPVGADPRLTG